jgi:V/A-type H+-transporting ATPase subunit D
MTVSRLRGVPPGRAGRLWLQRRLDTAERGAVLLDQKHRILRAEQQRLVILEEATRVEWERAARDAATWAARAGIVAGRDGLRAPPGAEPWDVTVTWTSLMGVRYAADATCRPPPADPSAPPPSGSAAAVAAQRHGLAVEAAVRHAVAASAVRGVEAELARTRRRRRAIEDRWLPRLRVALTELTLALEDQEHDDAVRRRWSAMRPAGQLHHSEVQEAER